MADTVDYILKFDSLAAAQRDLIVGPFFTALPSPASSAPTELLVFRDTRTNSTVAESGFWVAVSTLGVNAALASSGNLQITNDRTLMLSGKPSVISANFDVSHTNIIYSNFGVYCSNGLALIS